MARFGPTISAPLPEKWFAKESLTLLAEDGQANVIASSEPLDAGIDTEQYARVQGDLLHKEFPGYTEFSFEETKAFGGEGGHLRRFEWLPPDGVPVTQMQLYYVPPGQGPDLNRGYTATATTPTSEFERYEPDLRDILEGLLIDSVERDQPALGARLERQGG
jgi:hypothetical protein